MNSIKNVPARVLSRRPGHSLEAEREQFDKTQASAGTGWAGGGGGSGGGLGALGPACADGCGLRGPGGAGDRKPRNSRAGLGDADAAQVRTAARGPGRPQLPAAFPGKLLAPFAPELFPRPAQYRIICWVKSFTYVARLVCPRGGPLINRLPPPR